MAESCRRVENTLGKGEIGTTNFSFSHNVFERLVLQTNKNKGLFWKRFNPLPDMPILGSSSSAVNKDMMARIWMNGDTIICLSRKHCEKRRNCSLRAISPFPTIFSKAVCP